MKKETHDFYYSKTQKELSVEMAELFPETSLNGLGKDHKCMINGKEYTECISIGKRKSNFSDAVFICSGTLDDVKIIS